MTRANFLKLSITAMFSFMLLACTSSYESVTQVDDSKAFVLLTGNFKDTSLYINENDSIDLSADIKTFEIDGIEVAKFEVPSGTNNIKLYRNGNLVLNRKIYVTSGNSFEVNVK